jgi:predicted nucleotidyltransferase
MNDATAWRLALAQRIADAYAADPNARVVQIAGSVGRGTADRFSDIEIDVYYERAPSEAERVAAVERMGAVLEGLDEDPDEWEEQFLIDGFHAASSTFLVETMERYMREVLDQALLAPSAQTRLYSLLNAIPVKGEAQITRWRERAAAYPDALVEAMLREHLPFHGFGYAEDMFVARDDLLALYDVFVRVERQVIGALLGLNRLYTPTPSYLKWMDESIAAMRHKPTDLSARLKRAFRIDPADGVAELRGVIADVFDLVDRHAPGFDTAPYRAVLTNRRPAWNAPPNEIGR